MIPPKSPRKPSRIMTLVDKATAAWAYVNDGVWTETRRSWKIDFVKTISLTLRSLTNTDLQTRACAMTYRTVLAIVPAFALVFAIGRGFGFTNLLQSQLFSHFPAQRQALEAAFKFVDSYLAQASEGIFVGVGIIFLLWTLISLMGDVEATFNTVWSIRRQRTMWRKITDYTAILLVLPIMLICSSGIQIFMSSALQTLLPFDFLSPLLGVGLDVLAFLFSCLFFGGAYMLIPNTKVKAVNALLSGVLAGVAFYVLQWLFVTGQMYVTKYNAIYGSFAFLPLFMIWLQLVWVITLMGAVICYASQNIFRFSFEKNIDNISTAYLNKVTLAVLTVVSHRFADRREAMTADDISRDYQLPPKLVDKVIARLREAGLINYVADGKGDPEADTLPVQPAFELSGCKVSEIAMRLINLGDSDFIPGFDGRFSSIDTISASIDRQVAASLGNVTIANITVNHNIKNQ